MTSALKERRVGAQRPRLQLLPTNATSSAGVEAEKLANACGLYLDDWQSWCLHHMLSEDPVGAWAASIICLIMPRQNGKNAVLEALELAAIFLFGEKLIVHSAHRSDTAASHMERMKLLVKANPELDAITRFYDTNGKERMVRTDTGAQILFITRGNRTLRGPSPQRIVFDEALELTDAQIQAMIPSLSAQSLNDEGAPQMIYTSSAPLAHSATLHRIRNVGLAGDAESMFYAEWGCELGTDPNDVDAWYDSNPGLGIRISEMWIRDNELLVLTEEGFLIERLGVVFPPEEEERPPKLQADEWAATMTTRPPTMNPGKITIGWEVSWDGAWASIAIGVGDVRNPYVEVIEHKQGAGWLPQRLVELVHRWDPIAVGCIGAGPSKAQVGAVMSAFRESKPQLSTELHALLSMSDYRAGCEGLYVDITQGRLQRPDEQGPLDRAALDAAEKKYGNSGDWSFDQRDEAIPITPLVAAVVARFLLPTPVDVVPPPLTQIF